jgi:hypothetical protein
MWESCFVIGLASMAVIILLYHNEYRKLEKYFYENNKSLFILLEICIFVILLSMVFNVRHIAYLMLGKLASRLKKN